MWCCPCNIIWPTERETSYLTHFDISILAAERKQSCDTEPRSKSARGERSFSITRSQNHTHSFSSIKNPAPPGCGELYELHLTYSNYRPSKLSLSRISLFVEQILLAKVLRVCQSRIHANSHSRSTNFNRAQLPYGGAPALSTVAGRRLRLGDFLSMCVLIACEFSGVVRRAFRDRGHDAWSCDLLPAEDGNTVHHFEADAIGAAYNPWDLVIAFPPCTHLCVSGARWFKNKQREQAESIQFFMALANLPIPRIAIENPIGIMSTRYRKPDQIIQPWQFGHGETKATCLWLKNLPPLKPTNIVEGREPRVHHASPGTDRWKERSRTLPGIAAAMAEQWGSL